MQQFEVSAAWMKACGYGETARVFPVIDVQVKGPGNFYTVERDGRPWVVWDIRGRLLTEHETAARAAGWSYEVSRFCGNPWFVHPEHGRHSFEDWEELCAEFGIA